MERLILSIETSCDDTSVAVVSDGGTIRANVVSSQIEEHAPYLGVVPEIASRAHLTNIPQVFQAAMTRAGIGLNDLSAVAVTQGPGLIGSLLVGLNFAKGLALGTGLPLIGVNHIRAHARAAFLAFGEIPLPALVLIVSGGHSHLFLRQDDDALTLLVKTRDDSAGEAFDKLAKMLDLGFPGGPVVDRLAAAGDPRAYRFSQPKISDGSLDFSFSGMKTAALRHLESHPTDFRDPEGQPVRDLCASFQTAVVQHLMHRVNLARERYQPRSLVLGGGVACNSGLREAFRLLGKKHDLATFLTPPALCTDNAAMVAAEAWQRARRGEHDGLDLAPDIKFPAYDAYAPLHSGG